MHHGSQIHKSPNFRYRSYVDKYRKKQAFKQDTSPLCDLCPLRNGHLPTLTIMLHNKHINNIYTNQHNKAIHAIAKRLLAHSTTRCFTLLSAGKIQDTPPDNTIHAWLLPCSCYLLSCKCLARLCPNILCLLGKNTNQSTPIHTTPEQFQMRLLQRLILANWHHKKTSKLQCPPSCIDTRSMDSPTPYFVTTKIRGYMDVM